MIHVCPVTVVSVMHVPDISTVLNDDGDCPLDELWGTPYKLIPALVRLHVGAVCRRVL